MSLAEVGGPPLTRPWPPSNMTPPPPGLWKRLTNHFLMRTPKPRIERQEHYGSVVWTHVELDQMRRLHCLCRLCDRCNPGAPDHCGTAAALFRVCQDRDIAMAVTRCPHYSAIPEVPEPKS